MKAIRVITVTLLLTPSLAHAEDTPFNIEASTITRDGRGGCKLALTLTNRYAETLQISASAALLNLEGTALGDGHVSFPPATSGRKSLAEVNFHSFNIAGGQCPAEFDVNLTTDYCFITGSSYELSDRTCKTTFSYNVRKRTPN